MEKKLYPLTPAQQMEMLNYRFCLDKAVLNICGMVYFEVDINKDLMLKATELAFTRNDAASGRMCKVGKELMQYFYDGAPNPVEVVDFTGKSEEEYNAVVKKWNTTPFPNKCRDTQLYITKLVLQPNGLWALYFNACHLVFDAYSLMMTLREVIDIYSCLRDDKPLPPPRPSCIPAYEADIAYYNSEKRQKDIEYFAEDMCATEPIYTSINGKGNKERCKGKRCGKPTNVIRCKGDHINLRIPKALNDKLNEYAAACGVSPQVIYMLALRSFLCIENDEDDVSFLLMVARRATVLQKRAGGMMVQTFPFRSIISRDSSFADAVLQMSKYQAKHFRHANAPTTELLGAITKKYKLPVVGSYCGCSMTYQPYFAMDSDSVPCHFLRLPNGTSSSALYISIMPVDNSGDILVNYEYNLFKIPADRVYKLHDYMLRFLENGLNDPSKRIVDL